MKVIIHHAVGMDFTIITLFFVFKTVVDAFHVEVFGAVVLQIKFAVMTPPVEVNICGLKTELVGSIDAHAEGVKQSGGQHGYLIKWILRLSGDGRRTPSPKCPKDYLKG